TRRRPLVSVRPRAEAQTKSLSKGPAQVCEEVPGSVPSSAPCACAGAFVFNSYSLCRLTAAACVTTPAGIGATSTMTRSAMANKETTVAELTETFRSSNAVVLTEYRGLTVAQLKELRTSIRADASYAVVKNTLTKIAAKEAGVEGLDDLLEGPSAIAFVHGDTVAVAKALRDFAKANPLLVVKGGYFDGAALTAAEVG